MYCQFYDISKTSGFSSRYSALRNNTRFIPVLDRGSQTYYFKLIIRFILFYDLQNEMGHTTTTVDFKFSTNSQQPILGLTLATRAKNRTLLIKIYVITFPPT